MPTQSFRNVIKHWPTTEKMADDVGVRVDMVRKWYQRDFIHPRWWDDVVRTSIARTNEITLEVLAKAAGNHVNGSRGRKGR